MNKKNLSSVKLYLSSGVFFILLGVIILFTDYLDSFVTSLLWPILEGSSEGKTVLFLGLIGSILIFSALIQSSPKLEDKLYKDKNYHLRYLAIAIVILLFAAFFGLFIEALIRNQFGVSFFTILTAMDPNTSTTSPIHSHAYKSILGYLAYNFVPAHVNTASSILKYVLPYALIIIPIWISAYILGIIGLTRMRPLHRVVSIFGLSIVLIGILDGGLFSQPFLIGIAILLITYYSNDRITIKYFIKPVIILGYILLIGIIIEVGGSDMSDHTLTVVNQTEPVDMTQYNVTDVQVHGDLTIYTLNTTTPDKQLIRDVFQTFEGKADVTFMSWNFYTYLDNPTMEARLHA